MLYKIQDSCYYTQAHHYVKFQTQSTIEHKLIVTEKEMLQYNHALMYVSHMTLLFKPLELFNMQIQLNCINNIFLFSSILKA